MSVLFALLKELAIYIYMYIDKAGCFFDQTGGFSDIDPSSYQVKAEAFESPGSSEPDPVDLYKYLSCLADLTISPIQTVEPTSLELKAQLELRNMTLMEFLKYSAEHAQIAINYLQYLQLNKPNNKLSIEEIEAWVDETKKIDWIKRLWANEVLANRNTTKLWRDLASLELKAQRKIYADRTATADDKREARINLLWQANFTYALLQSDEAAVQFKKN